MSFLATADRILITDIDGSITLDTNERMPSIIQTLTSSTNVSWPGSSSASISTGRSVTTNIAYINSSTSYVLANLPAGVNFLIVVATAYDIHRDESIVYKASNPIAEQSSQLVVQNGGSFSTSSSIAVENIFKQTSAEGSYRTILQRLLHFEIISGQLVMTAQQAASGSVFTGNGAAYTAAQTTTSLIINATIHIGVAL